MTSLKKWVFGPPSPILSQNFEKNPFLWVYHTDLDPLKVYVTYERLLIVVEGKMVIDLLLILKFVNGSKSIKNNWNKINNNRLSLNKASLYMLLVT